MIWIGYCFILFQVKRFDFDVTFFTDVHIYAVIMSILVLVIILGAVVMFKYARTKRWGRNQRPNSEYPQLKFFIVIVFENAITFLLLL